MSSQPPEQLDRSKTVDLEGRRLESRARGLGLVLLAALVAVGLAGVLGQSGSSASAASGVATLRLDAPDALRSGLIYQARIRIEARQTIENPTLVLESGWFDGMTINSIQPGPTADTERNGFVVLTYGKLAAGDVLTVRLEPQVNPTTIGEKSQSVLLEDGGRPLLRIDRSVTVFP